VANRAAMPHTGGAASTGARSVGTSGAGEEKRRKGEEAGYIFV